MSMKLIALVALAVVPAGAVAEGSPEYQIGDKFEASEETAATLVGTDLAKLADAEGDAGAGAPPPPPPPPPPPAPAAAKRSTKKTFVRLLVDSALGNANDVIELDAAGLEQAKAAGIADDDKHAVAYAQSLPQNQPEA